MRCQVAGKDDQVGPLGDAGERLRHPVPVALVAVDVARGGDPDGLIRHRTG
jgi:hypothetical protein